MSEEDATEETESICNEPTQVGSTGSELSDEAKCCGCVLVGDRSHEAGECFIVCQTQGTGDAFCRNRAVPEGSDLLKQAHRVPNGSAGMGGDHREAGMVRGESFAI